MLNLNELMLTDVRDYLRNLATSNKGGEVKTSSPSFWEFCIKTSVKASAVIEAPLQIADLQRGFQCDCTPEQDTLIFR